MPLYDSRCMMHTYHNLSTSPSRILGYARGPHSGQPCCRLQMQDALDASCCPSHRRPEAALQDVRSPSEEREVTGSEPFQNACRTGNHRRCRLCLPAVGNREESLQICRQCIILMNTWPTILDINAWVEIGERLVERLRLFVGKFALFRILGRSVKGNIVKWNVVAQCFCFRGLFGWTSRMWSLSVATHHENWSKQKVKFFLCVLVWFCLFCVFKRVVEEKIPRCLGHLCKKYLTPKTRGYRTPTTLMRLWLTHLRIQRMLCWRKSVPNSPLWAQGWGNVAWIDLSGNEKGGGCADENRWMWYRGPCATP